MIPIKRVPIIGKMFLVNVRCYICFVILSLLAFIVSLIAGLKYEYFRKLRDSYLFSGVYYTFQLGFVDLILCSLVQFQHASFSHSALYGVSTFSACIAFILELAFVSTSVYLVWGKPMDTLCTPEFQSRFGAIFADISIKDKSKLHILTNVARNVLDFVLILYMILTYRYPLAQSVGFLTASLVALAWDIHFRPYRGRLLPIQMLVVDGAKFAAGVGYIVLSGMDAVEDAKRVCDYLIAVLAIALVSGIILSVVMRTIAVYRAIKERAMSVVTPETARGISSPDVTASQSIAPIRKPFR